MRENKLNFKKTIIKNKIVIRESCTVVASEGNIDHKDIGSQLYPFL